MNHRLLLHKLEQMYGINGPALKWLTSYLERRKQRVILNGKVSDWAPAVSGTPEGGHMSALLFSLFASDLASLIKTNCLMYADDLKICSCVSSQNDVIKFQQDLDTVVQWAAD